MIQIWALDCQSGSDRLEKRPTDLRQNICYFGDTRDRTLLKQLPIVGFFVLLVQIGFADQLYQELKQLDPGSELLEFKLTLCALLAGEENRATAMVDIMKFPGKTPAYYYARAAIALKRGQKETAQKYLENVKKYYSDEECAYFAQSLKEIDFTAPKPSQPVKMPDQQPQ